MKRKAAFPLFLCAALITAACAKNPQGGWSITAETLARGLSSGQVFVSDVPPEELLPPNERVPEARMAGSYYYGNSHERYPRAEFGQPRVEGAFLAVPIENTANKSNKITIENRWVPCKPDQWDSDGDSADAVESPDISVTIPPRKTVTVRIPIPDMPGKWSYVGRPVSETFP